MTKSSSAISAAMPLPNDARGNERAAFFPQVILTADDFGASADINAGIVRAHREGALTAASLMVNGASFKEAVELARQTPTLAVGLHLTISDGAPTLPKEKIRHLLNGAGLFPRDPAKVGLNIAFSRRARAELEDELRAQFEKFAATGLPIAHLDGHMHLHVHPGIFPIAVKLGVEFNAAGIRLPREPVGHAAGNWRNAGVAGIARTATLSILSNRRHTLLLESGLKYSEVCYGISRTGGMTAIYVADILRRLEVSSAEFVFHPTAGPRRESLGVNPGDLQTLLDPQVRSALEQRGAKLRNYCTLLGSGHST